MRSAQLYFDGANPTSDESKEFIFCMAAAQWLPASAGGVSDQVYGGGTSAGAAQHTCDMRMPGFYSSGKTWPQLSTEEQAYAYSTCLWPRMIMEHARVIKGVDWAPVDLLYNPGVRIPLLLDDLAYGYSVYTQYRDDRASLPWTVARDDKYASNWQASGFSVAHLPALRVMSLEAADLAMATDDATLGLTIEQYAARNVALGTAWRTRDPVVIAGTRGVCNGKTPELMFLHMQARPSTGAISLAAARPRAPTQTMRRPPRAGTRPWARSLGASWKRWPPSRFWTRRRLRSSS